MPKRVLIVGEAWGREEAREGRAFVGSAGRLLRGLVASANLPAVAEIRYTNLINARPPNNDFTHFLVPKKETKNKGLVTTYKPELTETINKLLLEIESYDPDLVIGCGNWPLHVLATKAILRTSKGYVIPSGIAAWRGSQIPASETTCKRPYLPIIHPAAALRQSSSIPLIGHDLSFRAYRYLAGETQWTTPPADYIVRPSPKDAIELLTAVQSAGRPIAIDIETLNNEVVCIGFATSPTFAFSIPFVRSGEGDPFYPLADELAILSAIRDLLSSDLLIIGQNYLYDAQVLTRKLFMPRPRRVFDTMTAHHVLLPGAPKALHTLASLYCSHYCYWKEESEAWDTKRLGLDDLLTYNCKDVAATYEIFQALKQQLSNEGLEAIFSEQMQLWHLALKMMLRGIRIDPKARLAMREQLMRNINELETFLTASVPAGLLATESGAKSAGAKASPWFRSPKQQMRLFYDILGCTPQRNRKTGQPTVAGEALQSIAAELPIVRPLVAAIEQLRTEAIFANNFLSARTSDFDNRMRFSFKPTGTYTFRWSSSASIFGEGTNMQNIPKGDKG